MKEESAGLVCEYEGDTRLSHSRDVILEGQGGTEEKRLDTSLALMLAYKRIAYEHLCKIMSRNATINSF